MITQTTARRIAHGPNTFILIHGSWHAAWNWHKVVPLLEEAGHTAVPLDMPGHGLDHTPLSEVTLQSCVDVVCQAIDAASDPVILVAHSRNGVVISQAAEARPHKIKSLVYLAAYLIPSGQAMLDWAMTDTESLVLSNVTMNKAEGSHMLKAEVFREALYADCPDEIVALAQVLLTPEPNLPGATPLQLTAENYGRVPKVYIECLQDWAVTPALQRHMYTAVPVDRVISMNTSHSPFFSQPQALTEHLLQIAAST